MIQTNTGARFILKNTNSQDITQADFVGVNDLIEARANDLQFSRETSTQQYTLNKMGNGAGNVIQSVDEAHGSLFSLHVSRQGQDHEYAIINKYDITDGPTLDALRYTKSIDNTIGHQGLSYEKTVTRIDAQGNTVDVDIFWSSRMGNENKVVRFEIWDDPNDDSNLLIRNVQDVLVWKEDGRSGSASPTISHDGAYLIVEDTSTTPVQIRVFNLQDPTDSNGDLKQAQPVATFDLQSVPLPAGTVATPPLQGLASDGDFIYLISGYGGQDDAKGFEKYTITGERVGSFDFEIGEIDGQGEPEGIYFTEDGRLAVTVATGPAGDRTNTVHYVGDTLGTTAADQLVGDQQGNWMFGFDGDDIIEGGKGADILTGGAGRDVFVFAPYSGQDIIRDYQVGIDSLQFGGLDYSDLDILQDGNNTTIHYGVGDIIIIENLLASDLAESDFIFL